MKSLLLFLLCISGFFSCSEPASQKRFSEVTSSGISFKNQLNSSPKLNILNYLYFYNGAGIAAADFNNDGLVDLYFVSNQEQDALYLNKGNLQFENNTQTAGISNANGWSTGISTVDINNDGLLDIYISKVSGHLDLKGHNLLYVNQGMQNNIPIFKEESKKYGLDFKGLNTQSTFFDYDKDGDLDLFLLRHSVHPNANYNKGSFRNRLDSINGDKLFKNDQGTFVDVSTEVGILQNKISYGLGVSIGDLNNDNFPDIYIGNDFFENDYVYINQQNGTFKELNTTDNILGHSSHFSMGNAIADINNDGLNDIVSVDMLPRDLQTYKTSGNEYTFPIYQNNLRNGYQPQYMQNTLHLNSGQNRFAETAFASGIAASEWSWAPLVADYDADGHKDLYITNGILGATNDMDFVNFIANDKIQKRLGAGMTAEELSFIEQLPQKATKNVFFKNNKDNTFSIQDETWFSSKPDFSNGGIYADLDNDGDLDIATNNVNSTATILENNSAQKDSLTFNYLSIKHQGSTKNPQGVGTKIVAHTKTRIQYFQNQPNRGYLSSMPAITTIGLGTNTQIDSLEIYWPDNRYQILKNIASNQTIKVVHSEAEIGYPISRSNANTIQTSVAEDPNLSAHKDLPTIEFDRDPLIPYASTHQGPKLITGYFNNDALQDLIIPGAKGQPSMLSLQKPDGSFSTEQLDQDNSLNINEDIGGTALDANNDGKMDVLIISGGNEFKTGPPLFPRLYIQQNNRLVLSKNSFPQIPINASQVSAVDIDNDGDMDLAITSDMLPRQFGKAPSQYLFENDGSGKFKDITKNYAPDFQKAGNIGSMVWADLNKNGYQDVILAGHWTPIQVFYNNGKSLKLANNNSLNKTHGLWNTLELADLDQDGDLDIIAGNWGLNTRLRASEKEPVTLYRADFDSNQAIDPIVTYFYEGEETTLASKDELVKQLPFLNKAFLSYSAFAKADVYTLFSKKKLEQADKRYVYELASCYFENLGSQKFKKVPLPFEAQISTIHDIEVSDFNNDGQLDLFAVGNTYEISTQLGRLDGAHGLFLIQGQNGTFTSSSPTQSIKGASRSITKIIRNNQPYFVIGRNNMRPLFVNIEE